jgi:hypothetical protein
MHHDEQAELGALYPEWPHCRVIDLADGPLDSPKVEGEAGLLDLEAIGHAQATLVFLHLAKNVYLHLRIK